ncbi:hypothetical protein [Mumia zhuanghuii]|nr:hypothetical protein [Mumia zhuanghuii]
MRTRTAVVLTAATVVLAVAGASDVKVCLTKKNVVVGASKKSR